MKDLRKFIKTTIREYLNECNNSQIYYHVTPLVNVLKIKKEGIKMGDGDAGKGVYLSKTSKEALTWKNIFDTENEYAGKYINKWYVIELINLDENKIDKGDEFDMRDGDFYYTEWVYRDDIPTKHIKSMYLI